MDCRDLLGVAVHTQSKGISHTSSELETLASVRTYSSPTYPLHFAPAALDSAM